MFGIGVTAFTVASAAAALAPTIELLVAARAIQGVGAALVLPLTLTLLNEAVPSPSAGMALGVWAGVSGLGVALGPFVGGAVVEGIAWQWIFWLNVPVGLALVPLAARHLRESHGPDRPARPSRRRAGQRRTARPDVRDRARRDARLDERDRDRRARPRASPCSSRSSPGSAAPRRRCCRRGCSPRARSARRTSCRSRCSSACSARSSCSRRSSRPRRATARSRPGCGRCRGRACRCSSRRSPGCSATGSARGR